MKTKILTFDDVRQIGLKLPETEEGTAYGAPTLMVRGNRFCGIPVNKSAEPNSLAIHCEFAVRDEMIAEQPDLYYTADHYINYPCVLVRLNRVSRDVLKDLLLMAHKYASSRPRRRRRITQKGRRTKA